VNKTFAVRKAGSQYRLAKLLGLSRQAVSQWGEAIPLGSLYRLRELRPRWFAEYRRWHAERT
jgi:hypothetical protein